MASPRPLRPTALRRRCNPSRFRFQTTEELDDLDEIIGQPRAVEALDFGIGIRQPGFNLFAFGPAETGMRDVVWRKLSQRAAGEPTPDDWIYVFNFDEAARACASSLPPGCGGVFRLGMERLIEDLRSAVPAAFESDEYRARAQVIEDEVKEQNQAALLEIEQRARKQNIALVRTPMGMGFAPMQGDEVVNPEVFNKLPVAEREKVSSQISALQDELQEVMRELPRLLQAARERVKALTKEVTTFAVEHLIDSLRAKYADIAEIVTHLTRVQDDVIENAVLFRDNVEGAGPMPGGAPPGVQVALEASLRRYQVNLLVDHSDNHGAPVVHETDPSYQNLVGRVEHLSEMGALITDFNLIKPGALHLANGGYLILDARKVLTRPYAWEGLKEAVRAGEIRIESLGQMFSLISTVSLEPGKIPVRVKVVMLGDPMLYYLLQHYDPEFAELFKVPVDFDDRMARDVASSLLYARFIATQARAGRLKPLDPQGVALVIEESARLAGDSERLSTLTREVSDVLAEADYRASERRSKVISGRDIRAATEARQRRSDRIAVRMREEIERGTILIETDGARPGQINGLSVIQLGGFSFGRPSRITARVRMGRGQVIDIEREVKLGGATHSKGVLILSNFLAARFSTDTPLSLAASLAFEQSYGGIDGDSASSTELYAILSALAEAPIDQGLAVTGSVNQFGEVQAIGGVNQKIEGFYDLCDARGLTGRQGVLIPKSNVKHLMLREGVVAAADKNRFHVYPVETIDQGIEILTGVPGGRRGAKGAYPPDSINGRVLAKLRDFAEKRKAFGATDGQNAKREDDDGA